MTEIIKLSRSTVEKYLSCPRCCVLDKKYQIKPPSLPFTLNIAVDNLCKNEFDYYRKIQGPHPLFIENGIDAVPFKHKDLERWRSNFQGIRYTSIEAISDSFSFKTNGFSHTWPSYQPDSSYSTFSDINLLNIWFQPRYNLIEIKRGIDKLLKKLNKIYFKRDVLKYILPEEITRNKRNAPTQNFTYIRISDFFVFGLEKILDFDNSMNSFVGCCSLGTGHLDSIIK